MGQGVEKGQFFTFLRSKLNIKPGEEKLALLLFLYFLLITAPFTIINILRRTDLLEKLGPEGLPKAYLFAAIVTGLVVVLHSHLRFRMSIPALTVASLVFFAVSGLLIQLILLTDFGRQSGFLSYLYWVWANVMIIILMAHFGMTINRMFNPREAKRLIGFVGSGGSLGGVLGGLLAASLTNANFLMLLAWGMLLGCVFVVKGIFNFRQTQPAATGRIVSRNELPEDQKVGFKDSFDAVRKDTHLILLAVIVAVGVIVSLCIDFQFNSAALGEKDMQAFFGYFYLGLNIFAFILSLFLTGYLLRKLGMTRTLLVTPIWLLICSLAILFSPMALLPAILIKGGNESLTFSLNQSVREILYIPVAAPLKLKAKPFIDMFISPFAKVVGALILLVYALLLHREVKGLTPIYNPDFAKKLSWIVLAFLLAWVLFGLKIGKEYIETVKKNIKPVINRVEEKLRKEFDVDYAVLVFDTIDSRNYSSVLYALYLFDLLAQAKLTPEIKNLISEESGKLKAGALSDLYDAGGIAWFPEVLDDFSLEGFVTEVHIVISSPDYQQLMKKYMERILKEGQKSKIQKMELAKAIGLMDPDAPLADQLTKLIDDDSPEVSCIALKSAARLKKESYIPAIIGRLSNFLTLEEAVDALHKYGNSAMPALEEYLKDRSKDAASRRAVVEVLARIGTKEAVLTLTEELKVEDDKLDEEIIDALDRVRSEDARIPLSASVAKRKTFSLVKKYCQAFIDLQTLEDGEENAGLRHHLARILEIYFADIFKLLGLYYPHEDIRRAYQNLRAETRNSVAFAIELLDNALKKDVKDAVLPLVEDMDPAEKMRKFQKILRNYSDT
jgi:AAA family ATP:ADP antiporter